MGAVDVLLDLLFPPKCPFCGALLEKDALLCPECQDGLPWLRGADGEKAVEAAVFCTAPLRYEGKVREAVHAYKFGGKDVRGKALGILIARCVREHGVRAELVSWPPVSKKRLRERGYDQAKLLADSVGMQLGLPVLRTLRKQDVPAQSGISDAAERRDNVRGAYTALEPKNFAGKRILLVDDVVTTGATLSECAGILKRAGAGEITCATLARAR